MGRVSSLDSVPADQVSVPYGNPPNGGGEGLSFAGEYSPGTNAL